MFSIRAIRLIIWHGKIYVLKRPIINSVFVQTCSSCLYFLVSYCCYHFFHFYFVSFLFFNHFFKKNPIVIRMEMSSHTLSLFPGLVISSSFNQQSDLSSHFNDMVIIVLWPMFNRSTLMILEWVNCCKNFQEIKIHCGKSIVISMS